MVIITEFYKRLRSLCEERGLTINELVKILDLSSGSPTAWKKGATPREVTLSKIADYFGVTTDYLLGKEKTPTVSGERDILDEVDIAFYNGFKELTEEQQATIRDMVQLMRARRSGQDK